MRHYSSREAAKEVGLHLGTLQRYIAEGKIWAPPLVRVGANTFRVWTDADIERVRRTLPKIANGRKTRYRKLREKNKKQARASRPKPASHKKK